LLLGGWHRLAVEDERHHLRHRGRRAATSRRGRRRGRRRRFGLDVNAVVLRGGRSRGGCRGRRGCWSRGGRRRRRSSAAASATTAAGSTKRHGPGAAGEGDVLLAIEFPGNRRAHAAAQSRLNFEQLLALVSAVSDEPPVGDYLEDQVAGRR